MVLSTISGFARRENRDRTMDSICRKCYATVATAYWELDLEIAEHSHVCDPAVLQYWNSRDGPKRTNQPAMRPSPSPTK